LASTSDRAAKENFHVTDPLQILTKVVALPIESWNYIGEGARYATLAGVAGLLGGIRAGSKRQDGHYS
jgi:hypothetical protein